MADEKWQRALRRETEGGFERSAEVVKRSLARLELAFILRQQDGRYFYPVPLFRKLVLAQDPAACLREV